MIWICEDCNKEREIPIEPENVWTKSVVVAKKGTTKRLTTAEKWACSCGCVNFKEPVKSY